MNNFTGWKFVLFCLTSFCTEKKWYPLNKICFNFRDEKQGHETSSTSESGNWAKLSFVSQGSLRVSSTYKSGPVPPLSLDVSVDMVDKCLQSPSSNGQPEEIQLPQNKQPIKPMPLYTRGGGKIIHTHTHNIWGIQ